jgi:tetratricopeptide (TPR) repeat protein
VGTSFIVLCRHLAGDSTTEIHRCHCCHETKFFCLIPMKHDPGENEIILLETNYRASLFLDSYHLLETLTPPEDWPNTRTRLIAARTLWNLGALRRSGRLLQSTWHSDRGNIGAFYYHALHFVERHGPFETLRLIGQTLPNEQAPEPAVATDRYRVYIWLLRARLLAQFHDFEAAEPWLEAAEQAQGNDPWTYVEKSCIRLAADRYEEALEAAQHARALDPNYRPAIEVLAHLLELRNRDEEAESLLHGATAQMQCATTAQRLATLLIEQEKFTGALDALEAVERFSPLAEKSWRDWRHARQAEMLYRLGRRTEAVAAARKVPGRYFENFAQRLETNIAPESSALARIQLPVGFVRQHNATCAPATISAISAFWRQPIDHLALARVITYDGTPDHEERYWLETHGWHVREFRVTWEAAFALLNRGVPFTLISTWVRQAHLQAVVGCDPTLGTFIIRDPYFRTHSELLAAEFLEQQASFGPRGMVLLPLTEAHRLDGIDLPDAPLYDTWFRLRRALAVHDRALAVAETQRIEQQAANHRLMLWARRQLAYYDDNPLLILETVILLRAQFPNEPNLQLEERSLLNRLGRPDKSLEILPRRDADPAFWRDYIEHLRTHARDYARARRWAHRLVHLRSLDCWNLLTFAHVLWDSREFAQAMPVYRLAATLGDKAEQPWRSFFAASRHERRLDEALTLLHTRWQRLASASYQPTQTLCQCLESLHRTAEVHEILKQALILRPEDGALKLFAAETQARAGNFVLAQEYLAAARNCASDQTWQRTAATLATWQADHTSALQNWRTVLATNPLDTQALRETARLTAITAGRAQTLTWLSEQITRFPHFLPLRQILLEWLRAEPPAAALAEIEKYLPLHPTDAWALRERALILLRARQPEDALQAANLAEKIDPHAPASPGVVGEVLISLRRFPDARKATERGLRLSIDADWLMPQLLKSCAEFQERRAAVEFLREELKRQVSSGGAFLRFQEVSTGVLTPEELQDTLEALRATQAEHWEVWSVCRQQALARNQPDRALILAEESTRRFPLLPRVWLDLADVHRFRNEPEAEMAALVRTRELSPGWAAASLRLASLHERSLHLSEAEHVLRTAVHHDPLNAELHAQHARLLWNLSRQDEAFTAVEHALALAPAYMFAWNLLAQWAQFRGESDRVLVLARRLVEQRQGDAAPHLRLARELARLNRFTEALEETDIALKLAPIEIEAWDLRAMLLAFLGRYDEALATSTPEKWPDGVPKELSGRAAWVEWQRNNRAGAVEAMRRTVAIHPDYFYGWQLLADWLDALGEKKQAAQAAERLAALEPNLSHPLGYVANLKIKAGEKREAADYLQRALRLDPTYSFAAFTLLRLQCEWEKFPEAEQTLALIRQHATPWHALHCEILLQRTRLDRTAAQRALHKLCQAPAHATDSLLAGAQVFFDAGWQKFLVATLEEALPTAGTNPEAGALWMRARLSFSTRPRLRWLDRCGAGEELRRKAYTVYINWLGQKKSHGRLSWLLLRRRRWLRADNSTWGAAGYALAFQGFGYRRWLVRWMHDWPQHSGVQPWMLYNLTQALYHLGRDTEAERVVNAALQKPADHTRPAFVGWGALQHALAGDYAAAGQLLAAHDGTSKVKGANLTAEFARALVSLAAQPARQRRSTYGELRKKLHALHEANKGEFGLKFVRRAHLKTRRALASLADDRWRETWFKIATPFALSIPPGKNALVVVSGILVIAGIGGMMAGNSGSVPILPVAIMAGWAFRSTLKRRR